MNTAVQAVTELVVAIEDEPLLCGEAVVDGLLADLGGFGDVAAD
jgi:hypothetical protein